MVKSLLRLESLLFLLTSFFVYYVINGNWLLFVLLLLTPDISMIGYLKNKKLGATVYNLVHNYATGLIVLTIGYLLVNQVIESIGIILFAHVALDRLLGFGLKYPSAFKDTHLQKI